MATLKGIKRAARSESLSGKIMVDTVRGVLRVRKWPRKRGTPKSESQRWWNDWFRQANLLTKYVDAATQRKAIELTANTGMYPRDIILKAMRGRLYIWQDQTGKVWYPMAGIQDISESLDVLAQNIGSVLVRATDRWRSAVPGTVGDVLTYQGDEAPASWEGPAATGVVTVELAESPISPDNSTDIYIFDVTAYASVDITLDGVGLAASDSLHFRFSTDNGVSYKAGGTDYRALRTTLSTQYNASRSTLLNFNANSASNHNGSSRFDNLRAGRATQNGFKGEGSGAGLVSGFARFDGPVTHIKLMSGVGNNFNAGTIHAAGTIAA